MTPDQMELVHRSFERIVPIKDFAARLFYRRLFETHPKLRQLFPHEMTVQGDKMMIALATVVSELKHPQRVAPFLESLARRHSEYGVRTEDFSAVGDALLWTLNEALGPDFTGDIREAWGAAYRALSDTMAAAMQRHSDAA